MDLTTRCPHCGTTFAASLEQLQLRKGYIRCVQCAHIFDGYEAVVPAGHQAADADATTSGQSTRASADSAPATPSVPVAPPSVVRGRREFTISDHSAAGAPQTEPFWIVPGAGSDPADAATDEHDARVDPAVMNLEHISIESDRATIDPDHVRIAPDYATSDTEHITLGPEEQDAAGHYTRMWRKDADGPPSVWWRTLTKAIWALVIAAGVLVFAAQLVYVFRTQIAENVPALRPVLERMCTTVNCSVPYARQIDMIVITQSSLQQDVSDSIDGADRVLLQLTLRNVHDSPQEWPTLVLELKDFSGATIARKHLSKDIYLPVSVADGPFPADSERRIALPLTMQGLEVNGYQLTAFFP